MRTLHYALIAILMLLTTFAYAETASTKGYYSSKHPKEGMKMSAATQTAAASAILPPTDITITNASTDVIYAVVPNSPIYDTIYQRNNLHIYNDYLYDDTYLVLKDPYAATFYSGLVCRRAIMVVYGQPGRYTVYMDREFCAA